jgi:hypothetical protein
MSFNRQEIIATIRERAGSDPEFRALLMSNPSAAVTQVIGVEVPSSVRFTVHEESPTDIHLVLRPADGGEDLSETDLELVAGGVNWGCQGCGCIA